MSRVARENHPLSVLNRLGIGINTSAYQALIVDVAASPLEQEAQHQVTQQRLHQAGQLHS